MICASQTTHTEMATTKISHFCIARQILPVHKMHKNLWDLLVPQLILNWPGNWGGHCVCWLPLSKEIMKLLTSLRQEAGHNLVQAAMERRERCCLSWCAKIWASGPWERCSSCKAGSFKKMCLKAEKERTMTSSFLFFLRKCSKTGEGKEILLFSPGKEQYLF